MMHSTLIDQDTITRYLISCDMRIVLGTERHNTLIDQDTITRRLISCDMRIVLGTLRDSTPS